MQQQAETWWTCTPEYAQQDHELKSILTRLVGVQWLIPTWKVPDTELWGLGSRPVRKAGENLRRALAGNYSKIQDGPFQS